LQVAQSYLSVTSKFKMFKQARIRPAAADGALRHSQDRASAPPPPPPPPPA
jgi:hypothetical protein